MDSSESISEILRRTEVELLTALNARLGAITAILGFCGYPTKKTKKICMDVVSGHPYLGGIACPKDTADRSPVNDFLEDCVFAKDGGSMPASLLYMAFVSWWGKNRPGSRPPSQKVFGSIAKGRIDHRKVGGRYYYFGVEIKGDTK